MLQLKNYMEEIVIRQIDEVINDMDMCTCDKCRLDIAAIALNNLCPKYVVTDKGKLYSKIESLKQQFDVDVTSAIVRAAVRVKENPMHG